MRRRVDFYCRIDAAAFASVLLVLFQLLEGFPPGSSANHRGGVELAQSKHSVAMASALRGTALKVSVSASGDVYFGSHLITANSLPEKIGAGIRNGAEKTVYVAVDSRARYADIKPVLTEISLAGVQHIALITQ